MNVRRIGEFAFGAGVVSLGAVLLFLAVGRLSAPIVPATQPMLAIAAVSADDGRGAHTVSRAVVRHARAVASIGPIAAPATAPRSVAFAEHPVPVKPHAADAEKPVSVERNVEHADKPASAALDLGDEFKSAPAVKRVDDRSKSASVAQKPATRREDVAVPPRADSAHSTSTSIASRESVTAGKTNVPARAMPRRVARIARPAAHVFGIAIVHQQPKSEPTPEPPIGYDEHPEMLRANMSTPAPSANP